MNDERITRCPAGYYRIYGFMERELMLKGSELRVYAILFSFTSGDAGMYYGTKKYLAESLMLSERSIYRAIAALFKRGLIENVFDSESGRSGIRCSYMREEERAMAKKAESSEENREFVSEVKERALDNLVIKKYGELPKELHLATRAAIRDRLAREAREKEISALVSRARILNAYPRN